MSNIVFLGNHHLASPEELKKWIYTIVAKNNFKINALTYQFIDDQAMLEVNQKYLNHDDFTDIITFDYTENDELSADIFISTERVAENAREFDATYSKELMRVLIHGVLHCLGYADKTPEEKQIMRDKENESLKLFHVEHKI